MKTEPDQFDSRDPADEALDRLLDHANWPLPGPAVQRRLRQHYCQDALRRRRGSRMGMLASACAAAAALVVALWLVDVPPAHQQVVTIAAKPRHPSPIVHTVAVRQPTPYEQLLMIEPKDKSMSPPANVPVRPAESAPEPPINEQGIVALLDRVRNVKTRSAALEELREMPHPPREQLMGMLHSPLVAQRFAAAQALGAICDDQLARSLDQMIDSDASWREALAVLVSADRSVAGRYLDDSPDRGDSIRSQAAAIRTVLSQTY